jgi:hypothetical protein
MKEKENIKESIYAEGGNNARNVAGEVKTEICVVKAVQIIFGGGGIPDLLVLLSLPIFSFSVFFLPVCVLLGHLSHAFIACPFSFSQGSIFRSKNDI